MSWKDKLLSRKFLAAVAAVIGAASGTISWDQAVAVVLMWLGAAGVEDAVKAYKK